MKIGTTLVLPSGVLFHVESLTPTAVRDRLDGDDAWRHDLVYGYTRRRGRREDINFTRRFLQTYAKPEGESNEIDQA